VHDVHSNKLEGKTMRVPQAIPKKPAQLIALGLMAIMAITLQNGQAKAQSANSCGQLVVEQIQGSATDAELQRATSFVQPAVPLDNAANTSASVTNRVRCDTNRDFLTVTLIPLARNGTYENVQIGYWHGTWIGKAHEGAVLVRELAQVQPIAIEQIRSTRDGQIFNDPAVISLLASIQAPSHKLVNSSTTTVIPDPLRGLDNSNKQVGSITTQSSGCQTVEVQKLNYTALGSLYSDFRVKNYFCYNGSQVTSNQPGFYFQYLSPTAQFHSIITSTDFDSSGNYYHETVRQARVDNCVPQYNCIGSIYPLGGVRGYGDGFTQKWTN
jgi:hypothetical protein